MLLGLGPVEFLAYYVPTLIIRLAPPVLFAILCVLGIRHFLREEKLYRDPKRAAERTSLAQVIARHRNAAHMTQEFVAQQLGVSRQAVSKWESGSSEPSTTNLIALAKLFGKEPSELLSEVKTD